MTSVLAALVWVIGLATLWWRAEPLIVRMLTHIETQAQRRVPREAEPGEPMPSDIILYAESQSAAWARDEILQRAHELYAQCRDWRRVSEALATESVALDPSLLS